MNEETSFAVYDDVNGLHKEYVELNQPLSEILDLSQFIKEAHE